jgi:hypothetical protein
MDDEQAVLVARYLLFNYHRAELLRSREGWANVRWTCNPC